MSARGRRANVRACFQQPEHGGNIHPAILKQARKSGQLNLSGRGLTEVPETVWKINIDVPEESRNVSLENQDDRWWEQTDLTKLILASNAITDLTDSIQMLPALTVLDLHDNQLHSLPEALGKLVNLQKLNASHNGLKRLPESLGQLKSLRSLLLHHNQIMELTEGVGQLHDLEDLAVLSLVQRDNRNLIGQWWWKYSSLHMHRFFSFESRTMASAPKRKMTDYGFKSKPFAALRTLDATHNDIHSLPDDLGDLTHLEQLYLRHNRLSQLPLLTHCTNIKELHLGNNSLHCLTIEQLECIQQVSVLDLRDNKISKLPEQIALLQQLERLDVSNNDISQLPFVLGTMNKLKCIVLDGNPMKSIRRDIVMRGTNELKKYLKSRLAETPNDVTEKAQGLRKSKGMSGIIAGPQEGVDAFSVHSTKALDYSGKKAGFVPADLWPVAEQAHVNAVNLNKNLLPEIPKELSLLRSSLTELHLGFNRLTSLDPLIGELTKLLMLDIRNNQISNLPDSLVNLQDLRELVISFNRFQELPKVVYNMSSLEILLASDNQIQDVDPDGVRGLSRLSSLNLQNNEIMHVPPELGLCTQLRALQLEGNPFRQPRPAILSKGTDSLLEYLRDRIVT
ncbi:hypothetical protein LSH36_827g00044 [Paralvinella palmiformis]|uniref:Disease resistance R13L4/SHOC-2-like LRR domain-containing protein n=1 Tax=Paralvinella palmiformis TaxID=53620 RepID=A0AAD9IZ72_9ANNE|nr:hypothetical protein LSH36_827g00044 [Paralvinella palmiformis]